MFFDVILFLFCYFWGILTSEEQKWGGNIHGNLTAGYIL